MFSSAESNSLLIEPGPSVVELATDLRGKYGLKTPDALHYATEVEDDWGETPRHPLRGQFRGNRDGSASLQTSIPVFG
jgi:hypothetical protein